MNKKIIVAAAIRNAGPFLKPIFENINLLTEIFDNVECVLVESDSNDNTLGLITSYTPSLKFELTTYSFGNSIFKIPNRMQRICNARNFYLDIVEKQYSDYDYLYVIDFNETNMEPYNKDMILSNFELPEWDMICANQEQIYYDIYALRHDIWMPFNCWNAIGNRPSFMTYADAHSMFVKSRFIKIDENHSPIKVKSAFGGSAFIKISSIQGARHLALDENNEEECEWVPFCNKLDKVYINPKFINMRKLSRHVIMANEQ